MYGGANATSGRQYDQVWRGVAAKARVALGRQRPFTEPADRASSTLLPAPDQGLCQAFEMSVATP